MNNNTQLGNTVEKAICDIFRKRRYWAYNCPKNANGAQPVDVLAFRREDKDGEDKRVIFWFVDGKHVDSKKASFVLNRTEDNQLMSMTYIVDFAGANSKYVGFVIYFERTEQFYWLPYNEVLEMLQNDKKSVNLTELKEFERVLDAYSN